MLQWRPCLVGTPQYVTWDKTLHFLDLLLSCSICCLWASIHIIQHACHIWLNWWTLGLKLHEHNDMIITIKIWPVQSTAFYFCWSLFVISCLFLVCFFQCPNTQCYHIMLQCSCSVSTALWLIHQAWTFFWCLRYYIIMNNSWSLLN